MLELSLPFPGALYQSAEFLNLQALNTIPSFSCQALRTLFDPLAGSTRACLQAAARPDLAAPKSSARRTRPHRGLLADVVPGQQADHDILPVQAAPPAGRGRGEALVAQHRGRNVLGHVARQHVAPARQVLALPGHLQRVVNWCTLLNVLWCGWPRRCDSTQREPAWRLRCTVTLRQKVNTMHVLECLADMSPTSSLELSF